MCVALQVQSEMADVFRIVLRLRHRTEHDFTYKIRRFASGNRRENPVDVAGFDHCAPRQVQIKRLEKLG